MPNTALAIITYNRPTHTRQVLNAVARLWQGPLYIFSDAPKTPANQADVDATRALFSLVDHLKPQVIIRNTNLGLARSIIDAANTVFDTYPQLILLEDDCVPQEHFFKFMQDNLTKYKDTPRVWGINGYTVPFSQQMLANWPYNNWFYPRMGSWGWATWKTRWQQHVTNLPALLQQAKASNTDLEIGGVDIPKNIERLLSGNLADVWTINWLLQVYLNRGVYVYPTASHIVNVGFDGTGVHCSTSQVFNSPPASQEPKNYAPHIELQASLVNHYNSWFGGPQLSRKRLANYLPSAAKQPAYRVVIVSTVDRGGGGLAAWRLLNALRQTGVESKMLVLHKTIDDPDVLALVKTPNGRLSTSSRLDENQLYQEFYALQQQVARQYPNRPSGYDPFKTQQAVADITQLELVKQADVINVHWAPGMVDYNTLPALVQQKKVVFTLHDMQPFTGGCHYSFGCTNWQHGCGNCPQLGSSKTDDLSAQVFAAKLAALQGSKVTVCAPSNWLVQQAGKSPVFKQQQGVTIANSIDLSTFKPYNSQQLKAELNLPANLKIILFVAPSVTLHRKGAHLLLQAFANKTDKLNQHGAVIGLAGADAPKLMNGLNLPFIDFGQVTNPTDMAKVYSLADVYVLPTLQDNLPNTLLESQACGTPVVAFNVGGVAQTMQNNITGHLVEPQNAEQLATTTFSVLQKGKASYTNACRNWALQQFSPSKQAHGYDTLFTKLLSGDTISTDIIKDDHMPQNPGTEKFSTPAQIKFSDLPPNLAKQFLAGFYADQPAQLLQEYRWLTQPSTPDFAKCFNAIKTGNYLGFSYGQQYNLLVNKAINSLPMPGNATGADVGCVSGIYPSMQRLAGYQVTIFDVRPVNVKVDGISSVTVDLSQSQVPENLHNRFNLATCISTIEHIGLGRYGDQIDPNGDFKLMRGLQQIVAPGGYLVISFPVGPGAVLFNLHRVYTQHRVQQLLQGWQLVKVHNAHPHIWQTTANTLQQADWNENAQPGDDSYQPIFVLQKPLANVQTPTQPTPAQQPQPNVYIDAMPMLSFGQPYKAIASWQGRPVYLCQNLAKADHSKTSYLMLGSSRRLHNRQFHHDWVAAELIKRGHPVTRILVDEDLSHKYNDIPALTQLLTKLLKQVVGLTRAQVLWVSHGGRFFSTQLIESAQQLGLVTMFYPYDDIMLFDNIARHLAPSFDVVFNQPYTGPIYKQQLGIDIVELPYGANPYIVNGATPTAVQKQQYTSDIFITGSMAGPRKSPRLNYIKAFAQAGLNAALWGYTKPADHVAAKLWRGNLNSEEEENLVYRSGKIAFSLTQQLTNCEYNCYGAKTHTVTAKMLDGAAAGCLVFSDNFTDLPKFFAPDELVIYTSIDDAVEKAKYYLANPQKAAIIAAKGQQRVLNNFTITQVVDIIDNQAVKLLAHKKAASPAPLSNKVSSISHTGQTQQPAQATNSQVTPVSSPVTTTASPGKLNILMVQHQPAIRLYKFAVALKKQGHNLTLAYTLNDLDTLYDLDLSVFSNRIKVNNPAQLRQLAQNYQLVHVFNEPDWLTPVLANTVPIIHDIADITSLRDRSIIKADDIRPDFVEAAALAVSAGQTFSTKAQLNTCRQMHGLPLPNAVVIGNHVLQDDRPQRFFGKLSDADGCLHLVYQGGLGINNHRDMRPLLTQLAANPSCHVHVLPPKNKLPEPYKLLARFANIHLHDALPPSQLLEYMTRFDAGLIPFVLTPQNKAFLDTTIANKLWEYLAAGLPVATTPLSTYQNFFAQHPIGFCFNNVNQLFAQLPGLLEQTKNIDLPGLSPSLETMIDQVEQLYYSVLR